MKVPKTPLSFCYSAISSERIRVFEKIGASVGLQLSSNRIVFLEGKKATDDKRILDKLAGPKLPGVLFIASGSSVDVQGSATRASLLIEHANKDTAFLAVLDRDYRDEESVKDLSKRLNGRAFIWSCHEIENLLLDEGIIFDVLRFNGCSESFESVEQVKQALLSCAKSLASRFSIELATYRIHMLMNNPSSGSPRDIASFKAMIKSRQQSLSEAYSDERADHEFEVASAHVENCITDGTWPVLLPGKEILEAFRKQYLSRLDTDIFREQIVARMVEKDVLHPEIERLCDFIKSV